MYTPFVGSCTGFVIAMSLDPIDFVELGGSDGKYVEAGCIIGALAGIALPSIVALTRHSKVPPERLLGLPPEDVDIYTKAYVSRTKRLKAFTTLHSSGVTVLVTGAALALLSLPIGN